MNDNFTDRFWSAIEQLENLNSDEVLSLIEENQNRTVCFRKYVVKAYFRKY